MRGGTPYPRCSCIIGQYYISEEFLSLKVRILYGYIAEFGEIIQYSLVVRSLIIMKIVCFAWPGLDTFSLVQKEVRIGGDIIVNTQLWIVLQKSELLSCIVPVISLSNWKRISCGNLCEVKV